MRLEYGLIDSGYLQAGLPDKSSIVVMAIFTL